MIEVNQVYELIDREIKPLPDCVVSLDQALGRFLHQDVFADSDQPPFDRSAVDGYAVLVGDASTEWTVISETKAGAISTAELKSGETIRVFTGGILPAQPICVIMQEDVERLGNRIITRRSSTLSHVRRKGSDQKAGALLISSGKKLSAVDLSVMASVGCVKPCVSAQPKIYHWATGDEIVSASESPAEGKIRDSNGPLIKGLLAELGYSQYEYGRWSDDYDHAQADFKRALEREGDLYLISGGSGQGDYDWTKRLLEEADFTIHCSQVNHRPGKPMIFATRGAQVAFGLPGNPVSHFVCFHLFVRRAICRLIGDSRNALWHEMILGTSISTNSDRPSLIPCRVSFSASGLQADPIQWNSSGHLAALLACQGLIQTERDSGTLEQGKKVKVMFTGVFNL